MRSLIFISILFSFISCSSRTNFREPSDLAMFEKNKADATKKDKNLYSQNTWEEFANDRSY